MTRLAGRLLASASRKSRNFKRRIAEFLLVCSFGVQQHVNRGHKIVPGCEGGIQTQEVDFQEVNDTNILVIQTAAIHENNKLECNNFTLNWYLHQKLSSLSHFVLVT